VAMEDTGWIVGIMEMGISRGRLGKMVVAAVTGAAITCATDDGGPDPAPPPASAILMTLASSTRFMAV
jgi:hypothetical protein